MVVAVSPCGQDRGRSIRSLIGFEQYIPKAEWFLVYNYVRVNSTTNVPAFSSNGGSTQVAYNFGNFLSAVADLGAYHRGVVSGCSVDNTIFSYLFGPRGSLRYSRVTPYFNMLFGAVYASAQPTTQNQVCAGTCVGPGLHFTNSRNVNANDYIENDLRCFAGVNLLVGGQLAGRAGQEGGPRGGGHPATSCPC